MGKHEEIRWEIKFALEMFGAIQISLFLVNVLNLLNHALSMFPLKVSSKHNIIPLLITFTHNGVWQIL